MDEAGARLKIAEVTAELAEDGEPIYSRVRAQLRHAFIPSLYHLTERVEIGLGVDERRVDVTMAQDIGDGFDRRVMSQGANGPGMTKGARALSGCFDASVFQMAADDHRNGHAVERAVWGLGAEKKFSAWDLTGPMLQILNQSVAHRLHERQHHFLAALLRTNANARVLPVDVIQEQLSRGNASDAIGHHQGDDGVIASSHWCFPRD